MVIPIRHDSDLLFVTAEVVYHGSSIVLQNSLLDTGSSGTIVSADVVAQIGRKAERDDTLRRIRGVGGSETVFAKRIDALVVGNIRAENIEIQIGGMDYGFDIDAILGLDFLVYAQAVIDLKRMEIRRDA